jgi:hypothetical protein
MANSFTLNPYATTTVSFGLAAPAPASGMGVLFVPSTPVANTATPLSILWPNGRLVWCDAALPPPGSPGAPAKINLLMAAIKTLALPDENGMLWASGVPNVLNGTSPALTAFQVLPCITASGITKVNSLADSFFSVAINFGGYAVNVGRGSVVSFDSTTGLFNLASGSSYGSTIGFGSTEFERIATIGPSIENEEPASARFISLSVNNDTSFGCLQFQLTLEQDSKRNISTDAQRLNAGFKYFYSSDETSNPLGSVSYPFIDTSFQAVSLYASVDLFNLTDNKRSYVAFAAFGHTAPVSVPTTFRTKMGAAISLTTSTAAQFDFSPLLNEDNHDWYYLVPSGAFSINIPAGGETGQKLEIMAGLFGTEYFGFPSPSGNLIYFKPGQNAYIKALDGSEGSTLTNEGVTSYVSTQAASGDQIYAIQSPYSIFYEVGKQAEPWNVFELPRAEIPAHTPTDTDYMPMVPYGGVSQRTDTPQMQGVNGFDLAYYQDYETFEQQLLVTARKAYFETNYPIPDPTIPPHGVVDPTYYATNPVGLVIGTDSEKLQWETLALGYDGTNTLRFDWLSADFREALWSSHSFIVMTDKVNKLTTRAFVIGETTTMEFGGWSFEFDPKQWSEHETICILKYYDISLRDLVNNTHYWQFTEACDMTNNATQKALQDLIADIDTQAANGNKNYLYFQENYVDNELWHGTLFFNCPMLTTTFPSEFALLSAGIDASEFYAHHFGISSTPVLGLGEESGKASPIFEPSSTFALIHYNDPIALPSTQYYDYKVRELEVRLLNSTAMDFKGEVQLALYELFGQTANINSTSGANSAPNNVLTLLGSAQRQNDTLNVSFTSVGESKFILSDSVVTEVDIQQARFYPVNTLPSGDIPAGENPVVKSRFVFDGVVSFRDLTTDTGIAGTNFSKENYDVFNYESITLRHYWLDMDFGFETPSELEFTIDASHMLTEASGASIHKLPTGGTNALIEHLPLRLTGFLASDAGQTLEQQGYMPLNVPDFKASTTLGTDWYAMVYELNLGVLGALAPDKNFIINLVTAWSPSSNTDSIWMGVKIPGVQSDGTIYSLEGIIKLGISDIILTYDPTTKAPRIIFQNLGLKILSVSFPPGGTTDIEIFGSPNDDTNTLAWMAAYVKDS